MKKAASAGDMTMRSIQKGFSTLELLIAFTIGTLIISAVVSIAFGAQYWLLASRTSGEGLYKAKTMLEDVRSASRKDFQLASSSAYAADASDASCAAGGLCYYRETVVTDISPCSKETMARVEWRVENYSTTTSELHTSLASPNEIVSLGSDCVVSQPAGAWTGTGDDSVSGIPGTPTDLDVYDGITYITTDTAPFFAIVKTNSGGTLQAPVTFANGFTETVTLNAVDVARDQSTGRTYAYVARDDGAGQLGIIDVTDPYNPVQTVVPFKLPHSASPAWRIAFYARTVYITTLDATGNVLSIVNVNSPVFPQEKGSIDVGTSVFDLVLRNQYIGAAARRIAYVATPSNNNVLKAYDVTNPASISLLGSGPSGITRDGRALFLSGSKAYIGLEGGSGDDLYVLDISSLTSGFPIRASKEIGGTVSSIRVSGDLTFVQRTTGTDRIMVLDTKTLTGSVGRDIGNLGDTAMDIDGASVFAGAAGTVHRTFSP
jgi:hypothetical protein